MTRMENMGGSLTSKGQRVVNIIAAIFVFVAMAALVVTSCALSKKAEANEARADELEEQVIHCADFEKLLQLEHERDSCEHVAAQCLKEQIIICENPQAYCSGVLP